MKITRRNFGTATSAALISLTALSSFTAPKKQKRIVLLASKASHGYGEHEHPAGCALLADRLNALPNVKAEVLNNTWSEDETYFDELDAFVVFSDGGKNHILKDKFPFLKMLADRGVGIGFMHYALDMPDKSYYPKMLHLIGGYYEVNWSVNPKWHAKFTQIPKHPITNFLQPFEIYEEFYYHMRFVENNKNLTPLLSTLPPASSLKRPDGPHSNNKFVRDAVLNKKLPQHLAWAFERPNGGRGFGYTGGHYHWNWANDSIRTLALNMIAWIAKMEIPPKGIPSKTPTFEELQKGLGKQPLQFNAKEIKAKLEKWKTNN